MNSLRKTRRRESSPQKIQKIGENYLTLFGNVFYYCNNLVQTVAKDVHKNDVKVMLG